MLRLKVNVMFLLKKKKEENIYKKKKSTLDSPSYFLTVG